MKDASDGFMAKSERFYYNSMKSSKHLSRFNTQLALSVETFNTLTLDASQLPRTENTLRRRCILVGNG